jgi:phosphomannomutase
MKSREHLLKVGVSGIRGVVGEFLTPSLACALGHAFGTYVGRGPVVVGRDTRRTGPMLQSAVHCGLLAAGCQVIDIGIAPTPTIQIYTQSIRARGGIAITASHNTAEYNALKLFNAAGLFFNNYERSELIDLWHQSDFYQATNREIQTVTQHLGRAPAIHMDRVLKHVDIEGIRSRRFRVAVDGVNGASSLMTPEFLSGRLNCELHPINCDPTQPFPRDPEPRPEVLGDLTRLVCETGAEVGFAHDPDGDRLAVVDETGRVLDNDDVLVMAVRAALEREPGPVVVNLTTTAAIDDVARQFGVPVYRTPVGEANVVEGIASARARIGGEGTGGGVIFPAVHLCRDSYTAMAFLLQSLLTKGCSMSQLADSLPRYFRHLGKVTYRHGTLGPLMQRLEQRFPDAEIDRTDGLKLVWPDRWIHVRSSNTEPLLRLAAEAKDEQVANDLYRQVQDALADSA